MLSRSKAEQLYSASNYDHFTALRNWQAAADAGRSLGALQGEAYGEFWTQRYADGLILHPARLENWGDPPRPRDFTRSAFVLNSRRNWLGHIRPPIEGIYDLNVYAPIVAAARTAPPYAKRLPPPEWEARHIAWASATPLEAIFAPHCESLDRSLSGAFAVLIPQYNLQSILGQPIERQMVQVGLLRIYEGGYVICPMPPPAFADGSDGVVVEQISQDGECRPRREVLNAIYVLSRQHLYGDTDAPTTAVSAGGAAYELGQWHRVVATPPPQEIETRPRRGFFVD